MILIRYIALWALLILLPTGKAVAGGTPLRDRIEDQLQRLYLDDAEEIIQQEQNPAWKAYYLSRSHFYRFLATEAPEDRDRYLRLMQVAFSPVEELNENDPNRDFMLAELHFMRGVVRLLAGKSISGATDLGSACNTIWRNHKAFPDHVESLKLMGLFNVAMSAVPRKWQWLSSFLCFKPDLNGGIAQLRKVAANGKVLPAEAEVALFYFEKNMLGEPDAAHSRMKKLCDRKPGRFPFTYFLISSSLESRQNDKAIALFERHDAQYRKDGQLTFSPYWDYSRGKAYFFKLDYPRAISAFEGFLASYKGRNLQADAIFRLGMSLALSGKEDEAHSVFSAIASGGVSGLDEDDYAFQMAREYRDRPLTKIDRNLYEARNLFDGGYFSKALARLDALEPELSSLNMDEVCEFAYRKGRILHESGKLNEAAGEYEKAMNTEPGQALWMKVYAMYYRGRIAEEKKEKAKARSLYQMALKYDDFFYQSGLEQRCKAALARLGN